MTEEEAMRLHGDTFLCDPRKHKGCSQSMCFKHGGECRHTVLLSCALITWPSECSVCAVPECGHVKADDLAPCKKFSDGLQYQKFTDLCRGREQADTQFKEQCLGQEAGWFPKTEDWLIEPAKTDIITGRIQCQFGYNKKV